MKDAIDFEKGNGLIPVIVQDFENKEVLMVGYMDKSAFEKTIQDGFVWFWSRKKKALWEKGATSGNRLKVKKIMLDCDGDAILLQAEIIGNAVCHTSKRKCFYKKIKDYDT